MRNYLIATTLETYHTELADTVLKLVELPQEYETADQVHDTDGEFCVGNMLEGKAQTHAGEILAGGN